MVAQGLAISGMNADDLAEPVAVCRKADGLKMKAAVCILVLLEPGVEPGRPVCPQLRIGHHRHPQWRPVVSALRLGKSGLDIGAGEAAALVRVGLHMAV